MDSGNTSPQTWSLTLDGLLRNCPQVWINFVMAINPHGVADHKLSEVLFEKYHAKKLPYHVVIFQEKTDLMLFLMHWS